MPVAFVNPLSEEQLGYSFALRFFFLGPGKVDLLNQEKQVGERPKGKNRKDSETKGKRQKRREELLEFSS